MWWNWSNLLSWGHMYQRLQRWVLDAKSMLTLTEVAVATSVPWCWVEFKHSAVVVGVGRHEPIREILLLLLVVIVMIVVFSVVVVEVALTESALTEWSLRIEESKVVLDSGKKYMRFKKMFKRIERNIEKMQTPPTIGPSPTPTPAAGIPQHSTAACVELLPTNAMRSWLQFVMF